METYLEEYVQHPLPVLFLKGLNDEDNKALTQNNPLAESLPEVLKVNTSKKIKELLGVEYKPSAWESVNVFNKPSLNQPTLINMNPPNFSSNLLAGTDRLFKAIPVKDDYTIPQKRPKSFPGMPSTHSTLSPFSPVSPLHPDGIITDLWLKKHFNENPCAIINFYDLWYPDNDGDQTQLNQFNNSVAILNSIKEKDTILANELNEIRKLSQENYIKFVVIIWNLRTKQDELFEDRIVNIRRASGLDHKTELFVLSRKDTEDLGAFISNLQRTIYEPSLQYYREKYRITKKKLSRVPSMALRANETSLSSPSIRPLSSLGWNTRFEFKLAIFSLIRKDFSISIKHFEAAYGSLSEMMMSSEIDVSNELRWGEAKNLIECINFHICRLYLYSDLGQASLTQLNRHIWGFKSLWKALSNKAPEFKFERNAWFARQYKTFAELLDCGIRFGKNFTQSTLQSSNQSSSIFLIGGNPTWKDITSSSSLNKTRFRLNSGRETDLNNNQEVHPLTILQHPGYYFYESAQYQSKRYTQYLLLKSEEGLIGDRLEKESKVDHSQLIFDSLSKSYEQFKKYKSNRMTIWVASEIAEAYMIAKKYDLALKFYERIAKTFRMDYWPLILQKTINRSIECVKNLPNMEESFIRYSIESLSPSFTISEKERSESLEALLEMMKKPMDNQDSEISPKTVVFEMSEISSFMKVDFAFKGNITPLNQPTSFQLGLSLLKFLPKFSLALSCLKINFDNPELDFTFKNDSQLSSNEPILLKGQKYDFFSYENENSTNDSNEIQTNLELKSGITKQVQGYIIPTKLYDIKAISISAHITTENWDLILKFPIKNKTIPVISDTPDPVLIYPSQRFKWLYKLSDDSLVLQRLNPTHDTNLIKVQPPKAATKLTITHSSSAYIDEIFPIKIVITPPKNKIYNSVLSFEWNKATAFKDEISLDPNFIEPLSTEVMVGEIELNESKEYTVYVRFKNNPGNRNLNSILTYNVQNAQREEKYEKKEFIHIEVIRPFKFNFKCLPRPGAKTIAKHPALNTFPCGLSFIAPVLTFSKEYLLLTSLICQGDDPIEIKNVRFSDKNTVYDKMETKVEHLACSFSFLNDRLYVKPNVPFSLEHVFKLILPCEPSLSTNKPSSWTTKFGQLIIDWNRPDSKELVTTTVTIPTVNIPSYRLCVELDVPSETFEGIPFTLTYTILNITSCTEEIMCSLDMNETPLVYSGYKVSHLKVLPHSYIKLSITCHALTFGKIKVPLFKVERKRPSLITPTQSALASTPTLVPSELPHSTPSSHKSLNMADIQFGWNLENTFLLVKPQHIKMN